MKVLVVQTNTYPYLSPTPLGATLVAMKLDEAGHQVKFVDLMHEKQPVAAAVETALEHRADLTCYSIRNRDNMDATDYKDFLPDIIETMAAVRAASPSPSLLGGTAFTTYSKAILKRSGADWGIAGDDLDVVSNFVESVAQGSPDLATPGLVFRDESGEVVANDFQIAGYQGVRFDNFRFIDFHRYRKGYWQAGVVTRTGCPEKCVYCDTFRTFGSEFRLREPAAVAEEMLALKKTGKVRSVFLVDAGFNRPLDHAKEVLREIVRKGAQLQLYCIHDPGEADREFFELLRRAGGVMVTLFAESLSDPVLEALRKPFTVEDIERDVAELRRAGVASVFMPTFGSPGETKETVMETLRRTPKLGVTMSDFGIGWRIQPNTELFRRAVNEGVIDEGDDCFEPTFYVSPHTPIDWLENQIKRYKRRHPFAFLKMLPMFGRMMTDRPWKRGAEQVASP